MEKEKGRKSSQVLREKERESFKERESTFSLNFPTIGPVVSGGARGRVHPHDKGFESRLKLRKFRQNPRGRSSPTLVTFYYKGCVVVVFP